MKTYHVNQFIKGWFIGDFEPSVLRTKAFEVAIKHHARGEHIIPHIHAHVTEYNYLASGKMMLGNDSVLAGEIFIIEAGEAAYPVASEDSVVVCIKVPSVPDDKIEITNG